MKLIYFFSTYLNNEFFNVILKEFPDNDYLNIHSDELKHALILEKDDFQIIQLLIEYSKDLVASNEGYYYSIISAAIGATIGGLMVYFLD